MRSPLPGALLTLLVAACVATPPAPEPPPPPKTAPAEPKPSPAPAPVPGPTPAQAPPPAPVAAPVAPPKPARTWSPLKPGDSQHAIVSNGIRRSYVLHVPRGYDPNAETPLVVVLHARGSSAQGARVYGFDMKADAARFAVAYPEALGQPRIWNAVHDKGRSDADDAGFVLAMLNDIDRSVHLDPRRVYLVGSSSGGMLAYRLAAQATSRFAAVAVIGASIGSRNARGETLVVPRPAVPISVMHIHGKLDRTVPYDGGKSVTIAGANYLGAQETARFWSEANGCAATPRATRTTDIVREVYTECRGGATVELVTVNMLSHAWPSALRIAPPRPPQAAADVLWDFFAVQVRQ